MMHHVLIFTKCKCILGAMNQLGRNLACEWASDNIRTNSVCPWFIETPLVTEVSKATNMKVLSYIHCYFSILILIK